MLLGRKLEKSIRELKVEALLPFPAQDGSKFQRILDEEMGFI